MMGLVKQVPIIIDQLEKTPIVLQALLGHIPRHRYRERRLAGKWTIHEQVCHLVDDMVKMLRSYPDACWTRA